MARFAPSVTAGRVRNLAVSGCTGPPAAHPIP